MEMKAGLVILTIFAAGAVALVDEDEEMKSRPVTKVINLMKDMVAQMAKEAEEDKDVYEQMGCWCETNDKEKTKSITDAQARIRDLGSAIEGFTASSSQLTAEIKQLTKEVAKNEEAVSSAKALRTKQLAEFNAEEKDMLGTIGSLKSAVVSLSKHNSAAGASLLQVGVNHRTNLAQTLRYIYTKHQDMLAEVITPRQRHLIEKMGKPSFIQQGSMTRSLSSMTAQAPAGGEIFGILSSMKESFETNLATSQNEEKTNSKAYEDLKAAKEAELAAGKTQISTKTQECATADEKNADSKEDLENTQDSLTSDEKFLTDVKEKCGAMDAQFAERTKARQEEMGAVGKALEFLTSDEAHALFSKTLGLIQTSKKTSARRDRVAQKLATAAQRSRDPRLSAIATRVRIDSFDAVKKNIQLLVDKLEKEKEEEVKHKDFCIEEFNKNSMNTEQAAGEKAELEAKVADFAQTADDMTKAIAVLKTEIAELKENAKRAGEDRELENKDYNMVVADQRATEKLLTASLNILKGFYEKKALVQTSEEDEQPAFKEHSKNKQSGGVMGMMEGIINEAKALEAEATLAEDDAQTAYESFVKNTNDSVDEKSKDVVNKSDVLARAQGELTEHKVQHEEVTGQIEQLATEGHDLHINCDFVMKNWDIRTEARDEEIDALKAGMAMFGGASFNSFLQHY